jgi:hypothetical protein
MNTLQEIILSMSKEELRFFKLYASRTNSHKTRKDILLFDEIKKSEKFSESKFQEKHYKQNKNAYYRLKNRLLEDINKSLTLQYLDEEADLSLMKNIVISRIFKSKGKYKIALDFLKKAEKKALQLEAHEILNIVYFEIIKLSHDISTIDVVGYIQKKKDNNIARNKIQEIDNILAAVMYRLKKAQNFSGKNAPIISLLEKTVADFSQDKNTASSSKLRIKIFQAASRVLIQRHDFVALEEYLNHTFLEFTKDGLFTKKTHENKLRMLTFLINALFKNNKLEKSLQKTQLLFEAMQEYDGFLHDKFLFYYYNSLVINYSKIDNAKAIEILLKAKEEKVIKNSDYNYFFVCSNLALLYFDKKQFKPSIKYLSRIILHKNFYDFALSFQLKIVSAELIIRYEIEDFDYLEQRIYQVEKEFKVILLQEEFKREQLLIHIIKKLMFTNNINHDKNLKTDIDCLLNSTTSRQAEETDIINYNKWLLAMI